MTGSQDPIIRKTLSLLIEEKESRGDDQRIKRELITQYPSCHGVPVCGLKDILHYDFSMEHPACDLSVIN